ncbi:N-acetylneuraminate synthase family protein [Ramlibacter humi]|uniref:N-acetylneuraminate synthase n=1 Tax=Ramlibacter humi TaxID=2530451 RepID=A0A4Z0BZW3_9BURK|nr:N-acetylneuraminate synthase family protein [Ramlibacter humi]TFZ04074.1 N-acetylneuraminate synthase [Ramlibacter humi]
MKAQRVFVIAEAGVNHNGDPQLAIALADAARAAGADAVKFQTFRAEDVVTASAPTADYQRTNTGATSQFEMVKALELSDEGHRQVAAHCARIGIEFFSTPFSVHAVDQLVALGVRRIKLPSGELTHRQLLEKAASTGLPLLLSSGMATLDEVRTAVGWIQGVWARSGAPKAQPALALLHCTSAYPAPAEALNLRAIGALAAAFPGTPVGYSDHSQGPEAALASIALGATVIEKHLTVDKSLPGPDHVASADPGEFAVMVRAIRTLEPMLGDGIKRPHPVEENTRAVARRSVVSTRDLPAGHVLQAADLALRRPGTGIAPDALEQLQGRKLREAVPADMPLQWPMLEGGA